MPLNARFEPGLGRFCKKGTLLHGKEGVFRQSGYFCPWFSGISGGQNDKTGLFRVNPDHASRNFVTFVAFFRLFLRKVPKIASLSSAFPSGT